MPWEKIAAKVARVSGKPPGRAEFVCEFWREKAREAAKAKAERLN